MPIAQILLASRSGTPPPTYTLTPDFVNVDEGANLTLVVGGTNIVDGTYYWTIDNGSEDFTTTNGTVSVTSNSGSFIVTPTTDTTTEGSQTFIVALREGSTSGTILATSGSVTINDTSFTVEGQYVFNGTPTSWATTNATVTTYGAYTYPNETLGSLHTLTGSQYLMSGNIGNNTVLNINLWFYPTANNLVIMGETGSTVENGFWHYSMLDIDNTNHLRGRLWQFVGATSTGTVTLNAWNHAYLYYNSGTGYVGLSLNNETAVTINTGERQLSDTSETYLGIGVFDSQNMSSNTRYQGKFDTPVINTTLVGSNYTGTKAKYLPSFSLVFNQPQQDYLSTPASSDWNLGNNWTMEFWIRSNNNSASNINIPGGQWGLINQGGWYGGMPNDNCILVGMTGGYLTINQSANDDIQFTEPTTQLWTHVAIVNNGGGSAQKVYYNGVEQAKVSGNYTSNGKTNITADLYIGRLSNQYAGYGSHFDGKMALIRISNTAKYSASFTPTVTYGVEADTKLFLNSITPLTDASASTHTITNNGTAVSGTFVNRYTALHSAGNQASSNIVIDTNPNNDAWAGSVPAGATVISQITGRFTVISTGREIGTNNWVFYIGGSNNFTAGETHTFIW